MATYLSVNISFLRKKLKISQQELANQLNLSRSNIASYESGKAEPRAIKLVEMARYFDVSLTQFIEEDLSLKPPEEIRRSNANIQVKLNKQLKDRTIIVDAFELKTERLRKVAIGFRALYDLRVSQIENPSPRLEKTIHDFENLLEIMDSLIESNEELISYLKVIIEE